MTCYCSKETWSRYLNGAMALEEQSRCERHLYGCETCLEIFTQCLTEGGLPLPAGELQVDFREPVMSAIRLRQIGGGASGKTRPHVKSLPKAGRQLARRTVLFHYAVASMITLVLMTSGVFQGIFTQLDVQLNQLAGPDQVSITQQLVVKTAGWLDRLQPERKGGIAYE